MHTLAVSIPVDANDPGRTVLYLVHHNADWSGDAIIETTYGQQPIKLPAEVLRRCGLQAAVHAGIAALESLLP